jgi:hypothetical protein
VHPNDRRVEQLRSSADRDDTFAEMADLTGDEVGADGFRALAIRRRLAAMALLDDRPS